VEAQKREQQMLDDARAAERLAQEDQNQRDQFLRDLRMAQSFEQNFFHCEICIEDKVIDDQFVDLCGHAFCRECTRGNVLEQINQRTQPRCAQCNEVYAQSNFSTLLDDKEMERYHKVTLDSTVVRNKDMHR